MTIDNQNIGINSFNTERADFLVKDKMSHRRFCLLYVVGVLMFYLWYQAIVNLLYSGEILNFNGWADFFMAFITGFPMLFMMFALNTLIVFSFKWKRDSSLRIVLDIVLSQAVPVIVNCVFIAILMLFGKQPVIMWIQTFVINFMVLSINEVLWFALNYRRSRQMYANARSMAIRLEYNVLRAQVNPHFLFNSLNTLYSLTHLDIEQTREFVVSLSSMYRYIMSRRDSHTVTLADELAFVDSYVGVLTMLYYDCFEVKISGKEHNADRLLIPYSLQLLIENVTKHNIISTEQPMKVHIDIREDGMTITNRMCLRKKMPEDDAPRGVGLLYLRELYKLNGKVFRHYVKDGNFVVEVPYIK